MASGAVVGVSFPRGHGSRSSARFCPLAPMRKVTGASFPFGARWRLSGAGSLHKLNQPLRGTEGDNE
jgi:hypothetical protein